MRGSSVALIAAGLVCGLSLKPAASATSASVWPEWDITALCGHDSARGQCVLLEREARRTLSGGWEAIPPELRSACLGEVKSPYDKSYRLLSSCLEHQVLKGLDRDLIDTATTAPRQLTTRTAAAASPSAPVAPSPQAVAAPAAAPKPAAAAPAAPSAPVKVAEAIDWPYLDPAAPSVAEEAQRRAAIAAELAAQTAARQKAEAEAATSAAPPPPVAAPVTTAQAIAWPYVEPSAASVAEEAQRRAAIAAELAAQTAARQKAEAEAAAAATAASTKPAGVTEPHPFAWPYLDPADASVAAEAQRRAAITAELKAAADARAKAEAEAASATPAPPPAAPAATPPPAEAPAVAKAITWPYVDPADATVAEEAKRRAAEAAELKAAADARAKAEAAERQAAEAAAAEALAAANRKREAARACQSALDAAAKSGVIQFKTASAALESKSTATLDRLAAAARSCGNLKIRISGHTDSQGAADRNQKLSEDRARAVADYLAGKGVASAGLESAGFGATKPIASNDTPAGRAKNRRIEFTVSAE